MSQQRRGYKIRFYVSGKGKDDIEYRNYSITVPSEIAEALPKDIQFLPKMTGEGLLFEPVDHRQIELPEWAQQASHQEHSQAHNEAPD